MAEQKFGKCKGIMEAIHGWVSLKDSPSYFRFVIWLRSSGKANLKACAIIDCSTKGIHILPRINKAENILSVFFLRWFMQSRTIGEYICIE